MTDGQQVLEFLYRQGEWSEAWTPDLVVLNTIMPKLNGWEVFERIKADSRLRTIPPLSGLSPRWRSTTRAPASGGIRYLLKARRRQGYGTTG